MRKPGFGMASEGLYYVGGFAFCALFLATLSCVTGAILFFLATLFSLYFFRDPVRYAPESPGDIVSPADGKIIKIGPAPDPFDPSITRTRICVFMNVFNVHVNRTPVDGVVEALRYHPGKFINASFDKASEDNERMSIRLRDKDGQSWTVVQIAGLIARRIVCHAQEGDQLIRGERFGLIMFGSRLDLYIPEGFTILLHKGDKVTAGESVLVRKNTA